jgi:hypothetical protein
MLHQHAMGCFQPVFLFIPQAFDGIHQGGFHALEAYGQQRNPYRQHPGQHEHPSFQVDVVRVRL